MNIIEACKDSRLFRPFLEDDQGNVKTWSGWFATLRALYGLPITMPKSKGLIQQVTGRDPAYLPSNGFYSALLLTGRRSGKSRVAAVIGAYEAALAGNQKKLSKGERGIVAIIAPTKNQGTIVRNYLKGIFETPLLSPELIHESREGFDLANGIQIRIMAGDFRSVRGFTLVAAIIDEVAFFGFDDESRVKSDTELIRAVRPSLATTQGKLIAISSPYAKKGWSYKTFKKHHSNDNGATLVVNCPSRTLNPTLPQHIVDAALEDDPAGARAEYLGEFRDDIGVFVSRELIEALVVHGRESIRARPTATRYFGFVDPSGGRSDSHALAIAHRKGRKVIIDLLAEYKPGQSPFSVVSDMAKHLRRYNIRKVWGDNFAGEWVSRSFKEHNIKYEPAEKNKSALYLEMLPRLGSMDIELLDNERLIDQLCNLERRTRVGGRDTVDHPPGGHDDCANVIAGVSYYAGNYRPMVGALGGTRDINEDDKPLPVPHHYSK